MEREAMIEKLAQYYLLKADKEELEEHLLNYMREDLDYNNDEELEILVKNIGEYIMEEVLEKLHSGICKVTFTKVDGTERTIKCTLQAELLPVREAKEDALIRAKSSTDSISVFETDLQEWRSFKLANLKSIEVL